MNVINLSELATLIIGLVTLSMGEVLTARSAFLTKLNIPAAVVGGLITSILVSILEVSTASTINFAPYLRDILILVFFVSLGLTAKIKALFTGGKPLFCIAALTVVLLCIQNIIGIAVALIRGAHPFYGLLAGSISFVGGPGTALAWAREATKMGLQGAELVAISAATLAVAAGALVSGPVTSWIIQRHNLRGKGFEGKTGSAGEGSAPVLNAPVPTSTLLHTIFLISVAIWLGTQLNTWAAHYDFLLPGFLCSLLAGMLITNLADLRGHHLPLPVTDRIGDISLQIFLAISLMSLKLNSIGAFIAPLMIVVVLQVAASIAVAYFLLFRMLGRNYDAAVTAGGFLGFAVSSMPVAMATMEQVTKRFGPAPKAILLITLVGSFFVDLANAFLVKGFLALLPLLPGG